jgi:hypothetical protein
MYFPDKGVFQKINCEKINDRKVKVLKSYEKGSCFGIESFFIGCERQETVRALKFGNLKFIERD